MRFRGLGYANLGAIMPTDKTIWNVVRALTIAVGALCVVLGFAWSVPRSIVWGYALVAVASLSLLAEKPR